MKKPSWIVMDIEGTTSSISFVHDVLFPYAYKNLENFLRENKNRQAVIDAVSEAVQIAKEAEGLDIKPEDIVSTLLRWINEDKKYTPLKSLQGMIWKYGYENDKYQSHIYEDVLPCWNKWKKDHIKLAIYSSGSVSAQKLLFQYTTDGNLCPYISDYFDTTTGAKRETTSYQKIAEALKTPSESILFLSDIVEELYAARDAGLSCAHIIRPGTADKNFKPNFSTFGDLTWTS